MLNAEHAAAFVGHHAIVLLLLSFVLMFSATLVFWDLFDRNEGKFWQLASRVWSKIQRWPPAQRFPERFPALWRLVEGRFAPETYLGLHFTISVCILLISGTAFLALADEVGEQNSLVRFDRALSISLHERSSLRTVQIFEIITHSGDAATLSCLGLIMLIVLVARRQRGLLCAWVAALLGVGFLNELLKETFRRMRPQLLNPWINETGWSFPSGHAMGSLVIYGMLAYTISLVIKNRTSRIILVFLTTSLVVAIGFSRIYLGVHYFSDVLAGYCAAGFWLAACVSGNEIARRHSRQLRSPPGRSSG
jgi:membrane-associated phospholipid phosphatase